MKKLNIIISNAPMQNGNRGCVALSISSMFILDKILSNNDISYIFIYRKVDIQNIKNTK